MQTDSPRTLGRGRRALLWVALLSCATAIVLVVAVPVSILMPFSAQTPDGLALALALRAWGPWLTITGMLGLVGLGVALWRGSRWWGKTVFFLTVAVTGLLTWFAHQNHFEWMFRPLATPGYVAGAEADSVAEDDRVLALVVGQDAAAYPIRQVAYHHIVNDVVGGTPVVVTY